MAAIAIWVLKLALEVIFWTLLIALRYRRSTVQKEEDILDRRIDDLETAETNDDRPESARSITKPGEPRAPRQTVLIAHAQKNWSRPFTRSARAASFNRHSPAPPERPPRSPLPYPHNLEPSPFAHSTTSLPGNTSPFLSLINRPKSRAPASPAPMASPLSIAEREASKMAGFDEWDTSELPMQDRIAYSIAAAEATSPDPGAPPHARARRSQNGITTRSHRSSSMPTPPRTPPQPRPRTNSMGSNSGAPAAAQRQSQSIISPTPTSPPLASTPTTSLRPFPISIPSQIKGMGINIPLCDSPEREHSVRLAASPLQKAHSLREVETHNRDDSSSTHSLGNQSRKSSMENNASNGEPEETTTAWQARWAAALERKVTPPMPGFEISPVESMRRMRVQREAQRSRQQQHAQTTNKAQPAPSPSLLSSTGWVAGGSSTNNSETGTESGMRSRRSYVAPATPNTGEFPRNLPNAPSDYWNSRSSSTALLFLCWLLFIYLCSLLPNLLISLGCQKH
ncbi:hypothetical protein TWF718_002935 [Orbilia javanica]|uniref:Uncharacterized protein n=1 Tax=Orbilia javanica TaxID=47235 RepID=A0AAN8NL57_9PEZI